MRYFSLLLFVALFVACGNDSAAVEQAALDATNAAQEQAYESMMEAHDRVMPLMGQITASQRALKEALSTADLPEDRKDLLTAAYEQLEDANTGMMDWMQGVKPLDELRVGMDNDAIMTYIKEEAADIAKVEMAMTSAIAAAAELTGAAHTHEDGTTHEH
ncbi:hypothetical protein QWY85_18080 [Neolewinella lacunae]|uniref:Uncharacterized protein n=1 Tax=Neolewinella lacunae TaxID=1517758 RepID=A0A923T9N3_9BACT|nr:hypothetical protein [Neolewinella lacunae]MBC6995726.1 hypothetical protein [Neolewinella lacunae]MDN3636581.1 hypothetical protein [Neolewinella lacunae]